MQLIQNSVHGRGGFNTLHHSSVHHSLFAALGVWMHFVHQFIICLRLAPVFRNALVPTYTYINTLVEGVCVCVFSGVISWHVVWRGLCTRKGRQMRTWLVFSVPFDSIFSVISKCLWMRAIVHWADQNDGPFEDFVSFITGGNSWAKIREEIKGR